MPNSLFVCAVVKILGIVCIFDYIFVPLQRNKKRRYDNYTGLIQHRRK